VVEVANSVGRVPDREDLSMRTYSRVDSDANSRGMVPVRRGLFLKSLGIRKGIPISWDLRKRGRGREKHFLQVG